MHERETHTHTHASVEWNQIYWIYTCNKHKHSISSVLCHHPQTHKVLEHTHKYTIKVSDFQTNRTKPKKTTCDVQNQLFKKSQTGCLGLIAEFEKSLTRKNTISYLVQVLENHSWSLSLCAGQQNSVQNSHPHPDRHRYIHVCKTDCPTISSFVLLLHFCFPHF